MNSTSSAALLIIAKNPISVRAKTRLAAKIGQAAATRIAVAMLYDTLAAASQSCAARKVLALDGDPTAFRGDGFEVISQASGDLGDRLHAAFSTIDAPAFLIGSDTPQISRNHIDAGLRALASARDAIPIGPTPDGGYWGIGMHTPHAELLVDIEMSTCQTFARTIDRAVELGLCPVVLPELVDLDEVEDLAEVFGACPTGASTRRAIEREQLGLGDDLRSGG